MAEKLYGLELLEKLSLAFGPTGCEDEVAEIIKEQIDGYYDSITESFPGNIIAHVKGSGHGKLMISAHMDEVGFMISDVDDDGFLYFQNVGGMDPKVLSGRMLTVRGYNGDLKGLICAKAIHMQSEEERKKATPPDKMYIDIGADNRADAEKYVEKGDYAVFDSDFVRFGDGMIKGKALDDRCGCAVMCDVIRWIKDNDITPYYDLYFAFTVREETGMSGATVAANLIKPDYSLVIECTAVADIPDVPAQKRAAVPGEGVAISVMDNSTVYFKEMYEHAMQLARDNGVKAQLKTYVAGGNDAGHIHKAVGGVKCISMSVPSRYIHSASCVIKENDFTSALELAKLIAAKEIGK